MTTPPPDQHRAPADSSRADSQRADEATDEAGYRAPRRGLLLALFGAMLGLMPGAALARRRPRSEPRKAPLRRKGNSGGKRVNLEVRVIEAKQGSRLRIDPKLKPLARDLKSLPFREYSLVDHHKKLMKVGEQMSFQFPGPGKKEERFLVVNSQGERGGKLRFRLAIDALKFRTSVAVPNGGTIVVGGPRSRGGNIIFAVTARSA